MKLAITIYPESLYEASLVIETLKGMRGLELDTFLAGKQVPNHFAAQASRVASDGEEVPTERPNVDPGEPSITKMGRATRDKLLEMLSRGEQPQNHDEYLKLLWTRGLVKFDGTVFYV